MFNVTEREKKLLENITLLRASLCDHYNVFLADSSTSIIFNTMEIASNDNNTESEEDTFLRVVRSKRST